MINILDFETNGLTYGDLAITQCSYLKLDKDLNIVKEYNKYFYSSNLKNSADITGLTHEKLADLSNGQEFCKSDLMDLKKDLAHEVIIGQNINYDIICMDAICIKYDEQIFPKYPLDIIHFYSPKGTMLNLSKIVRQNITEEGKRFLRDKFPEKEDYHNAFYDIYSVYALIKYDNKFKARLTNYLKDLPIKEGE